MVYGGLWEKIMVCGGLCEKLMMCGELCEKFILTYLDTRSGFEAAIRQLLGRVE